MVSVLAAAGWLGVLVATVVVVAGVVCWIVGDAGRAERSALLITS